LNEANTARLKSQAGRIDNATPAVTSAAPVAAGAGEGGKARVVGYITCWLGSRWARAGPNEPSAS